MVGTISVPGVSPTVAISSVNLVKGISAPSGVSFVPQAQGPAPLNLPFNTRVTFEGDSITRGSNGPAFLEFIGFFTGGRIFMPFGYNQGFGGDTAASMATPAETDLVLATMPRVVNYMSGINDLGGTTDTPATIFANQRAAIAVYQAAGADVVFFTTLKSIDPRFTADPQRELDRQALVAMQLAQTDVFLVNMEPIWNPATMTIDNRTDPTDPTQTDVGLHPNYLGALTIGRAGAAVYNARIFAANAENAIAHSFDPTGDFTNLMLAADNPQFDGFAGTVVAADGVTGVAPTQWTLDAQAGSGLVVVGTQTTLHGNNALQIDVSGSNALTESAVVTLRNVIDFTGDAAGDVYEQWWDITVANTLNLEMIAIASGATTTVQIVNVFSTSFYPDGTNFAALARTSATSPNPTSATEQPAEIVSDGTLTSISAAIQFNFPPAAADGTPTPAGGTFVVAAPNLFRVVAPH